MQFLKEISQKRVKCPLQVLDEILPQMEELKHIGVLCTNEGRMQQEIDNQFCAASIVMWTLYQSGVVRGDLSKKSLLSIYQSIYVPTLTCGHEL